MRLVLVLIFTYAVSSHAFPQAAVFQGELELGRLEERDLTSAAAHRWHLALDRGELAVVEVYEIAIGIELRVLDPEEELVQTFEVVSGFRADRLFWYAETSGDWSLEVTATEGDGQGAYEIEWIRRRPLGESELGLLEAEELHREAARLSREAEYEEAEAKTRAALAKREEILGEDDPDVAHGLVELANLLSLRTPREAEDTFRRALDIQERVLGPDHPDLALTLSGLGWVRQVMGRYLEAELDYRRALSIDEQHRGLEHPRVADDLWYLANLQHKLGMFAEAETAFQRASEINLKTRGKPHSSTVDALASLYKDQGRYEKSEAWYRQALAIRSELYGPEDHRTAMVWGNLANLFQDQGKYAEAEVLYQRAIRAFEQAMGPESLSLATNLNNLANLYLRQGRYEEAQTSHQRALAIREAILGEDSLPVAQSRHNLAEVEVSQDHYAEARLLYERALAVHERLLGSDHRVTAEVLASLGNLYRRQGNALEAVAAQRRSLSIRERDLGSDHPLVAESLYELSRIAFELGSSHDELDPAELDRAIRIFDGSTASPYPRIDAYALRARIRHRKGDREGALADLSEALSSAEALRPSIGGGEETRAGFFQSYAEHFDRMVAWQLEAGDLRKAFAFAERGRARVLLDQLAASGIDLRASIPSERRASLEKRESDAKARLAEYRRRASVTRSRRDLADEERSRQLVELAELAREAERDYQRVYADIKNASPLFRDLITSQGEPVALDRIQRELVPSSGLMLVYQLGDEESHLFLIPERGDPESIPLELGEEASKALGVQAGPLRSSAVQDVLTGDASGGGSLLRALRDPAGAGQGHAARALHALWQTLVPPKAWARLRRSSRVVLVPDDALHYLPFEALVVEEPVDGSAVHYWLDDGPAIRYAPSATTLRNLEGRAKTRAGAGARTALSLVDPIYERTAGDRDEPSTATPSATQVAMLSRASYQRAGGSLERLPGTAREAELIREVTRDGAWRWQELRELEATEKRLREEVSGKRYLHLATHGLVQFGERSFFSALALTPPPEVREPENDGFLQLHEIYELPLTGCELAVLSACQTNLGRNIEGEGPFALSRAFLAAGSLRVVASQWSVDDDSSAELIGDFFRRILEDERAGRKVDYVVALRDAKRALRARRPWSKPFFWAPFILTGLN